MNSTLMTTARRCVKRQFRSIVSNVRSRSISNGCKVDRDTLKAAADHAAHVALTYMQGKRVIDSYAFNVFVDQHHLLCEREIPVRAVPGDALGDSGLIVSSDGTGRGIVLGSTPRSTHDGFTVRFEVRIKPLFPHEWFMIDFEA